MIVTPYHLRSIWIFLFRISQFLFLIIYIILFFYAIGPNLFAAEIPLTIIHSNDLHSHFLGFSPNNDYSSSTTHDDETVGGWARIAHVIKEVKAHRSHPVLVLDAGDFMMGSLFHLASREEAFELRLLAMMGYDVITLGNLYFSN